MGDAQDPVADFIAALREAATALTAARDRLADARIPDAAMGKLFEAHAVRDAYHNRLPLTQHGLDQTSAVVEHIVAALHSGPETASAPIAGEAGRPGSIPGQSGGSAS